MASQTISSTSALSVIRQSEICLQQRLLFPVKLWLLPAVHIICCAFNEARCNITDANTELPEETTTLNPNHMSSILTGFLSYLLWYRAAESLPFLLSLSKIWIGSLNLSGKPQFYTRLIPCVDVSIDQTSMWNSKLDHHFVIKHHAV